MMPVTYRRTHGSDTWHFREDCAGWPLAGYDEQSQTPCSGVCCIECTYWPSSYTPPSPPQPVQSPHHRGAHSSYW